MRENLYLFARNDTPEPKDTEYYLDQPAPTEQTNLFEFER